MNEDSFEKGRSERGITQLEIDQRVYNLYDEFCHGRMNRRDFLSRGGAQPL